MRKNCLVFSILVLFISASSVLAVSGSMAPYTTPAININPVNINTTNVQTRTNTSVGSLNNRRTSSNSMGTTRSIGYSPSLRQRGYNYGNYYGYGTPLPPQMYQPAVVTTRYYPSTTTRTYINTGNGYNNTYTEQTTRYYGSPTIQTYPAGSTINANRYLNW